MWANENDMRCGWSRSDRECTAEREGKEEEIDDTHSLFWLARQTRELLVLALI